MRNKFNFFDKYFRLFRVKHYIKNFLIILPLFFGGKIFYFSLLFKAFLGFVVFSLVCSCIYIFNDIVDIEYDKKNIFKKNRPIASGEISVKTAYFIMIIMLLFLFLFLFLIKYFFSTRVFIHIIICISVYVLLNLLYSIYLKKIAILDLILLSSFYIIRIIFGGIVTGIYISWWLFLLVLFISVFLGLGKRAGELKHLGLNGRDVLSKCSLKWMNIFRNVFAYMILGFYFVWCFVGITFDVNIICIIFSVFFVAFILARYCMNIDIGYGDPICIIFNDKLLFFVSIIYILYMGVLIYA